jgi:chromate transporter
MRRSIVDDSADKPKSDDSRLRRLRQLAAVFLKLGSIGFGGPAVHFATIEEETVQRRGWLSRQHYLDIVGATNLIPGPNSTEVAMHVGYHRAGLIGLIVAGVSFILPAALLTLVFAWVYVTYGQYEFIKPVLLGVKPAVIVVILSAGWRLGRKALRSWPLMVICGAALVGSLAGLETIRTLLIVSSIGLLWLRWTRYRGNRTTHPTTAIVAFLASMAGPKAAKAAQVGGRCALGAAAATAASSAATPVTLWQTALLFLKVGAVLYGTGYVLVAYLNGGLVDQLQWLSEDQILDAFAVGNLTPGPILSTATFLGFILFATPQDPAAGLAGAAVATVCIFLPSFFFVAVLGPIIPRLRQSRWAAAFLDAVNAASIGLIAAVTLRLCGQIFIERPETAGRFAIIWPACVIAIVAAAVHFRYRVATVWLVAGGGLLGWLFSLAGAF